MKRTNIDKQIAFRPELQFEAEEGAVRRVYEQHIEVPASWNDYNAYLHIESVGADFTIFVNGKQITAPIDQFTPTDLFIFRFGSTASMRPGLILRRL